MKRLISVAIATLGTIWAGQAGAYSDEQMAAMSHIGQAVAGARICERAEIDVTAMAVLSAGLGVDVDDPTQRAVIKSKVDETVAAFIGKDPDMSCAVVMMLYGPKGENVPGLLKWKR